ncbi:lysostaphin resistance A-like protein [uncultured Hymenobacter sp.]|uniref:CPBP family intramembrane glutamic endopeptidase n=1 Tax=uncultured Hymenobacter sp. TaxID=170016 RepID=UPI0035CC82F4
MKGSVPPPTARHPALNLLLLVGLMLGAFCVGVFLVSLYAKLTLGGASMSAVMANPASFRQGWDFTMVSQGMLLLVGFGGAASALALLSGGRWVDYFAPRRPVPAWALLAAGLLIILMLPVMSALVEWNAKTHFPAVLRDFEGWARASEDRAQTLTKYLTQFSSPGRFLVGVLVVAVVPAIAEELFFRGVIQRNLGQWFSPHVGVWLAAAIFSAIHFQFFGFFPRFVLGLVLGYLYQWSGNILVPMAAHFTQNGFQLLLLYLQQQGKLGADFNPDNTESLPWPLVVVSAVLSAGLLFELYRRLRPAAVAEAHIISRGDETGKLAPPAVHNVGPAVENKRS